jgi:esterase/lipase superfamily enzyme
MERREIAKQLRVLLDSIRDMEDAAKEASDGLKTLDQQKSALTLIAVHKRVTASCYDETLHYKTRIKLLRVLDQATGLVEVCRLLDQSLLPDFIDPQRLHVELIAMCRRVTQALEPVVDYYAHVEPYGSSGSSRAKRYMNQKEISPSERTSYVTDKSITRVQWSKNIDNLLTAPDAGMTAKSPSAMAFDKHSPHSKIGSTEVPVYFGTTRSPSSNPKEKPEAQFLNGRGSGELTLGRAFISIPAGHRVGKLEQPLSIWQLRLKPNLKKHVVLRTVDLMTQENWVAVVRTELENLPNRMAFVYIHGFNVSFCQAMMRAGQIARDIGYEGLVTAFSWGSESSLDGYPTDEDAVQLAAPKLVEFLATLHIDAGVDAFHIVAHSMGCRALLSALQETSWWSSSKTPVAEAVFAAPDVDATQYRQNMSAIPHNAGRYTLYGSARDWAIAMSRSIRKNHPRAGDGGNNILVMNGVETVDATEAGEDLFGLGHSYFADKRSILVDLWSVLRGLPMPRFGLEQRLHKAGTYWALLP